MNNEKTILYKITQKNFGEKTKDDWNSMLWTNYEYLSVKYKIHFVTGKIEEYDFSLTEKEIEEINKSIESSKESDINQVAFDGTVWQFKKFENKSTYITIIDIDDLKIINDTLGHLAGDHVLRALVDILKPNDSNTYICRYGGDEFVVFHNDDIPFEKIIESFKYTSGASFSYGTVCKAPFIIFQDALAEADVHLYQNKKNKEK